MYEEIITTLSEFKTISTHITKLGKCRLQSEDQLLLKHIDAVISQLQIAHTQTKNKSMPIGLGNTKLKAVNELLSYCKTFTENKKPEWQVLAERNGWAPK